MAEGLTRRDLDLPDTGIILVGMGPGRCEMMTQEAINAARLADHRRYEAYTALWPQDELDKLEDQVGSITKVMRPEIEDATELLELAKSSLVAVMIVGDPLQATTHVDLQLQANEMGVTCKVMHGISITTILSGAIGLSNYKFGRSTTLTYPYGGWIATSPLEVIASNQYQGLHTLVLLDLDPSGQGIGNQKPMSPEDAYNSMELMWLKMEDMAEDFMQPDDELEGMKQKAILELLENGLGDLRVVLASDMGCTNERIISTKFAQLSEFEGGRLNCLVVPANLGEVEEVALRRFE